jgi:hypothetical protein
MVIPMGRLPLPLLPPPDLRGTIGLGQAIMTPGAMALATVPGRSAVDRHGSLARYTEYDAGTARVVPVSSGWVCHGAEDDCMGFEPCILCIYCITVRPLIPKQGRLHGILLTVPVKMPCLIPSRSQHSTDSRRPRYLRSSQRGSSHFKKPASAASTMKGQWSP